MKSIPNATPIILTAAERAELAVLSRSQRAQHRKRQRARIVLMAGDGAATREIARTVGCTIGTASKWRVRFARSRMVGLEDAGERGAEPKYGAEHNARILALLDRKPPAGHSNWTGPLLAGALGDIHVQHVWRFLRAQKIDLTGRKSWCVSNDPDFAAKAADIVGLYMAPPDNAIVFSIDEKPSIQALERAQGYLKLPGGRAMTGQSHDYKRHGTTTLFATLDLASGKVVGRHYKTAQADRVPELHEPCHRLTSGTRNPCRSRQSLDSQAKTRHVVEETQEHAFPLYADAFLMAQPDRDLVFYPVREIAGRRIVRKRARTHRPHRRIH
jgi:transposase